MTPALEGGNLEMTCIESSLMIESDEITGFEWDGVYLEDYMKVH